jgi:hypothetical protein
MDNIISDPHGHSRSSSASSLDVDEMLLCATTGDEHAGGGAPNGSGTPYIDSTLTILMSTSVVDAIERVILRDLQQQQAKSSSYINNCEPLSSTSIHCILSSQSISAGHEFSETISTRRSKPGYSDSYICSSCDWCTEEEDQISKHDKNWSW